MTNFVEMKSKIADWGAFLIALKFKLDDCLHRRAAFVFVSE